MTPPATPAASFAVALDRERRIAFTPRARYRMGTLDAPFSLGGLADPHKSYAALVAWLWACLVPADAADFPTPEDLADHVPMTIEACGPLATTLGAAINATLTAEPSRGVPPAPPIGGTP